MNTNNIYYAFLVEIIDKKFVLGKTFFDSGYTYRLKPLHNRYVYKSGESYIDLKSKNKYKLYSEILNSELEVGMIIIDDKCYKLINVKSTIDKCNLLNEDCQIEIKKYMSKRKVLRMISGGRK